MKTDVKHLARLIQMPVTDSEAKKLQAGFDSTLKAVNKLKELTVTKTQSTFQVTSLENVWRQDKLQPERQLTQKQALSNAKKTYQGYFVVPRVLNEA